MVWLCADLYAQGKSAQAINLVSDARERYQRTLGMDHEFTIRSTDLLATYKWATGNYQQALELAAPLLGISRGALGENHAVTAVVTNDLAWKLATAPELSGLRDPAKAVELGRKAVAAAPREGNYWNTLGVALYRSGDWTEAVKALEKSMELRNGGGSTDWLFLAMSHSQLGHGSQARQWHRKAVDGMEKLNTPDPELARFRAEAQALIMPVTPLPDNVFAR
jgi:tetratricopeptide (TPR) repeat protein